MTNQNLSPVGRLVSKRHPHDVAVVILTLGLAGFFVLCTHLKAVHVQIWLITFATPIVTFLAINPWVFSTRSHSGGVSIPWLRWFGKLGTGLVILAAAFGTFYVAFYGSAWLVQVATHLVSGLDAVHPFLDLFALVVGVVAGIGLATKLFRTLIVDGPPNSRLARTQAQ